MIRDIAHLGHVEIKTPRPEETLSFFRDILGLNVAGQAGQSVYLRAWGDVYHHTLKITEAPEAGLGHVGWRTVEADALQTRAAALADSGAGDGWHDGDDGHGPAYRFHTPDGHTMEMFFEVAKHRAQGADAPRLKNQADKIPLRGIGARRLDHVNLLASDVTQNRSFMQEQLGFKLRENIMHGDVELGSWLSVTPLVHDIALMKDPHGRGRFHHVAYWLDTVGDLVRAADILREYGYQIEAGPAKHAITNGMFIYLYEPGGNRVELFTGGYLIFDPDWEPVTWTDAERELRVWWGGQLPRSFFNYGTPDVETAAPGAAVAG